MLESYAFVSYPMYFLLYRLLYNVSKWPYLLCIPSHCHFRKWKKTTLIVRISRLYEKNKQKSIKVIFTTHHQCLSEQNEPIPTPIGQLVGSGVVLAYNKRKYETVTLLRHFSHKFVFFHKITQTKIFHVWIPCIRFIFYTLASTITMIVYTSRL